MSHTNTHEAGGPLSNYLADLAERIGEQARLSGQHKQRMIAARIEAGALLAEAKAECKHGEWGSVLARAGVRETTARNWMRLAASGLKPATVAGLGGVKATLRAIGNNTVVGRAAKAGEALRAAVEVGETLSTDHPAVAALIDCMVELERNEAELVRLEVEHRKESAKLAAYDRRIAIMDREIAKLEEAVRTGGDYAIPAHRLAAMTRPLAADRRAAGELP